MKNQTKISKLEKGAIIGNGTKEFISEIRPPFVCSLRRKDTSRIIVETTYFMRCKDKTVTLCYSPLYSPRTVREDESAYGKLNEILTEYEEKNAA